MEEREKEREKKKKLMFSFITFFSSPFPLLFLPLRQRRDPLRSARGAEGAAPPPPARGCGERGGTGGLAACPSGCAEGEGSGIPPPRCGEGEQPRLQNREGSRRLRRTLLYYFVVLIFILLSGGGCSLRAICAGVEVAGLTLASVCSWACQSAPR